MKPLKPSMRENKRYLAVSGDNLSRDKIEGIIKEFIGILGLAKSGLGFIKMDKDKSKAVISVNREAVNSIRASFAASPENISVKRVSGTLRGLERKNKSGKTTQEIKNELRAGWLSPSDRKTERK